MAKKNPRAASGKAITLSRNHQWKTVAHEFLWQQCPMIVVVMALGFAAAPLLGPAMSRMVTGGFQTANVTVAVWHLVWMGMWTGYTMALVGQAAGIFALPYITSVLRFDNPHVSPTMLVLTFISPVGALLGFRRSGQWEISISRPPSVWAARSGAHGTIPARNGAR